MPAQGQETPSALLRYEEERARVRAAVARLAERERQIVGWRIDDGLTFGEIGRRLGLSEDAARMAWNRALEKLAQDLGPDD